MTTARPADYLVGLVRELCKLPLETEWVEFKENDGEPEAIGEYLSALANSAALAGKAFAYLVWGVRDTDHAVVGTSFLPTARKVGNEELENWLLRQLAPKIHFRFFAVEVDGLPAPLFEVPEGFTRAVLFAARPLHEMDRADRLRACYLHACLKWVTRDCLTNASLRERFGIEERNKSAVSRYIRETVEAGWIRPFDEEASRKMMKYVPFWA